MLKNIQNKMRNKLGQISVVEFSLIALFFSGFIIYLSVHSEPVSNSYYSYNVETYLETISKTDSFRKNVFLENLSNTSLTQNWTTINNTIKKSYINYELKISNNSISKTIFSCIGENGKFFSKIFISSYNSTLFEPKTLMFGVCY